jgi:integrase
MPYKRGKYQYIIVAGTRLSSGTTDRKKAAALEHRLNDEAWERKHFGIRFSTWDEACLDWFKTKGASLRPSTLEHQSFVAKYWQKHLSGKSLRIITAESVRKVLLTRDGVDEKRETPGNATANVYAQFVRKIMLHAGMKLSGFRPFPASKGREQWLTVEDWRKLEAVMDEDLRHIVTFSLATGLRKANVMDLQWDWIKCESLLIPSAYTKTKVPYGIPLNKTAMGIIQARRSSPIVHARSVFLLGAEEVTKVRLHRAWKRALKTAGLEDMTYHGLRHTYASWMVEADVPFEVVARLGQWKLPGMIHKYVHFNVGGGLRQWALKFDQIITETSTKSSQSRS